jgi:hypothetical protein
VPVLIGLMLGWVQVADRITLIVAVVPLALACAVRVFQRLVRKQPLNSCWYDATFVVSTMANATNSYVSYRKVLDDFGRPERIYRFRGRSRSGTRTCSPTPARPAEERGFG